ncbi:pilus assembly PilX N-terminal domain-containing protein [Candidatus Gracilibacteria bacterium]|nr:pilus assembly PilX N-terminal domain-containing protein [Candidatus Gracilibacteria bacterium]MCF7819144.1 pilus assembly PilX N-terminal domain-containing protein [Candidatus Gracilibacteria bacterium]
MKWKNQGASLFITLGISFTILTIALSIMVSISRSLRESVSIERYNQVFFAAESGLEAAFYHHNARGQGVHFMADPVPESQKIPHDAANANVSWFIDGRTEGAADNPLVGLLQENQRAQFRFFADNSANPSEVPNTASFFPLDFNLTFYNRIADDEPPGSTEEKIYQRYGEFDFFAFDFGAESDEEVLIDWNFSGKRTVAGDDYQPVGKRESLVASDLDNEDRCDGSFLCIENTFTFGDFTTTTEGKLLPYGGDSESRQTVQEFVDEHEQVSFSFRPLQSFEASGGEKIRGIPFSLETGAQSIPKDTYTAIAEVSLGDFYKTISVNIAEKGSLGAFDYVIFD